MKTNPNFKEIHLLNTLLDEAKIPHEIIRKYDGWQIKYSSKASIIENSYSFGSEGDLLEMMSCLLDTDGHIVRNLTAEMCFRIIKADWDLKEAIDDTVG